MRPLAPNTRRLLETLDHVQRVNGLIPSVEWAARNFSVQAIKALDRRCLVVILNVDNVDYVKTSEAGRAFCKTCEKHWHEDR